MCETSDSLLLQAVLNDDIVLDSPVISPLPKINRVNKFKKRKQFFTTELSSSNEITPTCNTHKFDNYPAHHLLESLEVIPNTDYLEEVSKIEFTSAFSKIHIYRTVSEILNLKNCSFLYNNVQIIGVYNCGKINERYCHYIEDRRTKDKIEIDLKLVDHYPEQNLTILVFGIIVLHSYMSNGEFETMPYILVKFFDNLPDPEIYETVFHLQKQFRPKEFDLVKLFEESFSETISILSEINFENECTMFSESKVTNLIKTIESDELLYYEIERLMNINIS